MWETQLLATQYSVSWQSREKERENVLFHFAHGTECSHLSEIVYFGNWKRRENTEILHHHPFATSENARGDGTVECAKERQRRRERVCKCRKDVLDKDLIEHMLNELAQHTHTHRHTPLIFTLQHYNGHNRTSRSVHAIYMLLAVNWHWVVDTLTRRNWNGRKYHD